MTDRQKTNSITHLVKIVAEEVFNEKGRPIISNHTEVIRALSIRLGRVEEELSLENSEDFTDIENSPSRWSADSAGDPWTRELDEGLSEDFDKAVRWMAARHRRSKGAITARLRTLWRR